MIYLTQILVPYELAVRQLRIRDNYDWHQRAWQAFGGRDGVARDFLTRVDQIDGAYRLLVVSSSEPNKPDWCPTSSFKTKTVPETFFEHKRYRFSLLANATKKIVNPNKPKVVRADGRLDRNKNSKRIPLTRREDLLRWLERKAEHGGFALEIGAVRTIPRGREYFFKPGAHGVHYATEFQGALAVTNPSVFRETFARGIGSGKAFGFGLLVLAPIS
jgi:CRISPR system Cascade subunit CasE